MVGSGLNATVKSVSWAEDPMRCALCGDIVNVGLGGVLAQQVRCVCVQVMCACVHMRARVCVTRVFLRVCLCVPRVLLPITMRTRPSLSACLASHARVQHRAGHVFAGVTHRCAREVRGASHDTAHHG
jgi:hypothetical protein